MDDVTLVRRKYSSVFGNNNLLTGVVSQDSIFGYNHYVLF